VRAVDVVVPTPDVIVVRRDRVVVVLLDVDVLVDVDGLADVLVDVAVVDAVGCSGAFVF